MNGAEGEVSEREMTEIMGEDVLEGGGGLVEAVGVEAGKTKDILENVEIMSGGELFRRGGGVGLEERLDNWAVGGEGVAPFAAHGAEGAA